MELTVIGSGTVAPTAGRVAACHQVTAGPVRLMLDCGAGALHRAAALNLPWHQTTHVAITHFHVDHWGELAYFLLALRWGVEPARKRPLTVIGPRGLEARMVTLAATFGEWVQSPGYPLSIVTIEPGETLNLADGITLDATSTPHTAESVAYAVQTGQHRLVYTGDTGPSAELARWARGCDLLLCECSLPDNRAIDTHLTPAQAGTLARKAKARQLVLTHFYPPVESVDPVALAAQEFDGPITAAKDGSRFTIEETVPHGNRTNRSPRGYD